MGEILGFQIEVLAKRHEKTNLVRFKKSIGIKNEEKIGTNQTIIMSFWFVPMKIQLFSSRIVIFKRKKAQ